MTSSTFTQNRQAALGAMPSAELISRYDRPGPRYTSYPTAAEFKDTFTESDRLAAIASAAPGPLSAYIHVPFCSSPCFYCACTKVITRRLDMADAYVNRLEREIEWVGNQFDGARSLQQLHFGGGTPTFLSIDHLSCIFGSLDRHFGLVTDSDREYSIEIDPRTVQPTTMAELAALGFNRASFGIQDFDPDVQRAVNREQTPEETAALLDAARRAGFSSLSIDLIYGLPKQTQDSFTRTLDQVIAMQPDRVAAYSYAHLPERFKPQRQIEDADLPSAAEKLGLLLLIGRKLTEAGYVAIGMDHYARPADTLAVALTDGGLHRNFQGYSTHAALDLVGFGMSAISRIGNCYSQNARTLPGYYGAIDYGALPIERGIRLTHDDRVRRETIEQIMCRGEVDEAVISEQFGINFERYFAAELAEMAQLEADGLVRRLPGKLQVTAIGRHLLRPIAMPFDAYLRRSAAAPTLHAPPVRRYSRTI